MRIPKSLFILFLLLCFGGGPCFAKELEGRHFEKEGGFSYQPPKGWKIKEVPGMKYKFVFGPPIDRFSPNMNFVDEAFSGGLDHYVDLNVKALHSNFKGFEKFNQTTFKTAAGQTGIKLTTQAEQNGRRIRQTYYFFELSKEKKLVVTCSASAKDGEAFDKVFEETLETLLLANKDVL